MTDESTCPDAVWDKGYKYNHLTVSDHTIPKGSTKVINHICSCGKVIRITIEEI